MRLSITPAGGKTDTRPDRPVVGAWRWDARWPEHTHVSFTAHLNGVEAAPGVYGDHTLTQRFQIGSPNGTYLTIEKANPVDMVGPGYNIEVPWSVRFTWSGDYLHDAYWSVGDQGFTNVSHGCINMSPEDAETFYKMAVPGDPVRITGSPRAGTWDNG